MNRYLIVMEGYVCPRDPGAMLPRDFDNLYGKLVLTPMSRKSREQLTLPKIGPALEPSPGRVPEVEHLVAAP